MAQWCCGLSFVVSPRCGLNFVVSPRCDLKDEMDHMLKKDLYKAKNLRTFPGRIEFVMGWPSSVKDSVVTEPKFYNHGIWPHVSDAAAAAANVASKKTYERLFNEKELRKMYKIYKNVILAMWPDLKKPDCDEASLRNFEYQWRKHGFPIGMEGPMYLYYGLALQYAIDSDSFNIPVGIPISMYEAVTKMEEVLENLHLFGKFIGMEHANPTIKLETRKILNATVIKEVKVEFIKTFDHGKANLELMPCTRYVSDDQRKREMEHIRVILPSKEQMEILKKTQTPSKAQMKILMQTSEEEEDV